MGRLVRAAANTVTMNTAAIAIAIGLITAVQWAAVSV